MFEVASDLLLDFANLIPEITAIILCFNLCAYLLWGRGD